MANKLTATVETDIHAPAGKVWQALTDPAMVKQYLFGTDMTADWRKGGAITYKGEWNGNSYTDKGEVIDIVPEKKLHTTYYSGMSGKEDKPENYANVIYYLDQEDGATHVTLTQDNIDDEKQLQHMQDNWNMVLGGMKKLLEKS